MMGPTKSQEESEDGQAWDLPAGVGRVPLWSVPLTVTEPQLCQSKITKFLEKKAWFTSLAPPLDPPAVSIGAS